MKRRRHRKFLKDIALVGISGLALLGLFNYLIDPHGTFRPSTPSRLDDFKAARGSRISKAEQLRRGAWDIVILGNSRVDAGIDPSNPAWPSRRVFNCGLTGLNFSEEARVFEFLENVTRPPGIILCIDFFHFQDGAPVSDEFAYSRFNPDRGWLAHRIDALWSSTATWHSITTLGNYFASRPLEYSRQGLRIKPMAPPHQSGRAAFDAYARHAAETWRRQGPWSGNERCFEEFENTLKLAAEHRTHLTVVILPVHALELELLRREVGDAACLEQWKSRLVRTMADVARLYPDQPAPPLWDFTGYQGYTAEPIPPAGDPHAMKWYWEPSHFRRELGDLLIARLLGAAHPPGQDLSRFGEKLDSSNISAHLRRTREQRAAFVNRFKGDISTIERSIHAP